MGTNLCLFARVVLEQDDHLYDISDLDFNGQEKLLYRHAYQANPCRVSLVQYPTIRLYVGAQNKSRTCDCRFLETSLTSCTVIIGSRVNNVEESIAGIAFEAAIGVSLGSDKPFANYAVEVSSSGGLPGHDANNGSRQQVLRRAHTTRDICEENDANLSK